MLHPKSSTFPKIDFHNHIWLYPEAGLNNPDARQYDPPGPYPDPDGDHLIASMDRFGFEKTVIIACPNHIWNYTGDNADVLRAMRKHPSRFIGVMHLDFRDGVKKCVETIDRYAGEGMLGAKMFPSLGFYPDDPQYHPIYDTLACHRLFAAYHLGMVSPSDAKPPVPVSVKYAQPMFLDAPASLFPNLNFVICHMGGLPFHEQTLCMMRYHANVYADLSGGAAVESFRVMARQDTAVPLWYLPPESRCFAGRQLEIVQWDRLLYGIDSPHGWTHQFDFWVAHAAENGYTDKLQAMFHDNAARFFSTLRE
jgi:predicted TIM-barrel fold metal-dependent hydrolase